MGICNRSVVTLLSILLICGCSDSPDTAAPPLQQQLETQVLLPPLPIDRGPAELTEYLIDGTATFERSSGVSEDGTQLLLAGQAGEYAWAMYAFNAQQL